MAITSSKGSSSAGASAHDGEEMVVPADEYFTRCPVSKEVFETVWDQEEGEIMYRNAVKVMVTEKADPALYALSRATCRDGIRYAIVHKQLVLDEWIESGRVETLSNTVLRYAAMGKPEIGTQLAEAAEESEDEEDVFVLLDNIGSRQ